MSDKSKNEKKRQQTAPVPQRNQEPLPKIDPTKTVNYRQDSEDKN